MDASFHHTRNVQNMLAHQNHGSYWRSWLDDYETSAYLSNITPRDAENYCHNNLL